MPSPLIRIYIKNERGALEDTKEVYELETFAGTVPTIGEKILSPWVGGGNSRSDPDSREFYVIVDKIYNPRDMNDYIVLVCDVVTCTEADRELLPPA